MSKKAHAKLSASGSERWLNCPGSVRLCETAPPRKDSKYSKEGTDAHECLETYLKELQCGEDQFNKEMMTHAEFARNAIQDCMTSTAELLCETRIDLSFIAPDMFGTCDYAIIDDGKYLLVGDYKYGANISVDAKDNTQLIYYALGLAEKYEYNFSIISLQIIQPRAPHPDGPVRTHTMNRRELLRWKGRIARGVLRTQKPDAPLAMGEWCMFCAAKSTCPAYNFKNNSLLKYKG